MAETFVNAPIIAVVGPTASGKTALALELARRWDAELISADSRQMYRLLDAGTAKPEGLWGEEAARRVFRVEGIAYHLVDILDPGEGVDAGRFAALAQETARGVAARGKRAIFVGGTGLYLRAALGGLDPLPRRDAGVREKLAELAEANGRHWLHERLAQVDPQAARRIPPNNIHRVVRALEVFELTGRPISSLWSGGRQDKAVYIGISWPQSELAERIRSRCQSMFPAILEEVRNLVPSRYSGKEPGFQSIGYPEALSCLRGERSAESALSLFIRSTLGLAKRQATWFRRQASVRWIDAGDGEPRRWADQAQEWKKSY